MTRTGEEIQKNTNTKQINKSNFAFLRTLPTVSQAGISCTLWEPNRLTGVSRPGGGGGWDGGPAGGQAGDIPPVLVQTICYSDSLEI